MACAYLTIVVQSVFIYNMQYSIGFKISSISVNTYYTEIACRLSLLLDSRSSHSARATVNSEDLVSFPAQHRVSSLLEGDPSAGTLALPSSQQLSDHNARSIHPFPQGKD
jgi:hypothetical protein